MFFYGSNVSTWLYLQGDISALRSFDLMTVMIYIIALTNKWNRKWWLACFQVWFIQTALHLRGQTDWSWRLSGDTAGCPVGWRCVQMCADVCGGTRPPGRQSCYSTDEDKCFQQAQDLVMGGGGVSGYWSTDVNVSAVKPTSQESMRPSEKVSHKCRLTRVKDQLHHSLDTSQLNPTAELVFHRVLISHH